MTGPLYHGGVRHLRVGIRVAPPKETGAPSMADFGAGKVCRRDRVYLTSSLKAARVFASMFPGGAMRTGGDVYRVEPIGEVEHDPDCNTPGLSFQAPAARVVKVDERKVRRPNLGVLA